jgi:hypothetical protein
VSLMVRLPLGGCCVLLCICLCSLEIQVILGSGFDQLWGVDFGL